MYGTIIVPVDLGLESTTLELQKAIELAHVFDSTLHVIHVSHPADVEDGVASGTETELFETVEEFITDTNSEVNVEYSNLHGDIVTEIAAYTDRVNADLVVMSTHGRTGVTRLALGSVTSDMISEAECPVLAMNRDIEKCDG